MKNNRRIANLAMFRGDQSNILVTTDLTSRGLDINNVNMVINYHMPRRVADYIHRVGRTARNGYEGEAVSFLTPNEVEMFKEIEGEIGVKIEENELSDKPEVDLVSTFNKMKREVKINLVSSGVIEELEKRKEKKLKSKVGFFKAKDFEGKA
jgi:ATP-dependent RNA helicase DDX49/DBP8